LKAGKQSYEEEMKKGKTEEEDWRK